VAGIFEQPQRMTDSRRCSADFRDDVLVAVLVKIGKGDTVPFVQLARARRGGDVDEGFSLLEILGASVAQHEARR